MKKVTVSYFYLVMVTATCLSQELPPGFILEKVADGLNPTTFTHGPQERIYIADKSGKVWIIDEQDQLLTTPLIGIEVDDFDERGLGGISFHPRYEDFPYLYLYYTVKGANHNRLSRFLVNGDRAIPGSEEVLIDFDLVNGFIHNAGRLKFNQDEYLFITTGDGAEQWNAQDLSNLLGKILRIHPDGSIPTDNPFYQSTIGQNRAIWAYGFRNPFSMDIHQSTGEIYVGEVGLGTWEEVNEIYPGMNYGWPWIEGYQADQTAPDNYIEPRFAYHHDEGCAILGVSIFDEDITNYPEPFNQGIFYTDYCKGSIHYLDEHDDHSHLFATGFELPVDLQFGPDGNLYVLTRKGNGIDATQDNTRVEDGALWRISFQGDGPPRIAVQPTIPKIPVGQPFSLSVTAFGTLPLQYQWYQNKVLIAAMDSSKIVITQKLSIIQQDSFYCVVTNKFGTDTSVTIIPQVIAGSSPQPIILNPIDQFYAALDTIYFNGLAIDADEDTLSLDQLSWTINFHHDAHFHPSIGPIDGISGAHFIPPSTAETDTQVWYRINLTATDSDGLTNTIFKDVLPLKHYLEFLGPAGIPINLDGLVLPMPNRIATVSGVIRTVQAPGSYLINDTFFVFDHWQKYGTSNLVIQPYHHDETLRPLFSPYSIGKGQGLHGKYYPGIQNIPEGVYIERIDPVIDFVWQNSPPGIDIPKDRFTVVWTGKIEPLVDGVYTINTFTDDGVRLWIKDSLIIDSWHSRRSTQDKASIFMQRDSQYPIIMQYFEDLSQAVAQLHWSHELISSQIIPQNQLYPNDLFVPGKLIAVPFMDDNKNGTREPEESLIDIGYIKLIASNGLEKLIKSSGQQIETWIQPDDYNLSAATENYFLQPNYLDPGLSTNFSITSLDSTVIFIPFIEKDKLVTFQGVEWAITPNPVANILYFYFQSATPFSAELSLYNLQGQLVLKENHYREHSFGSILQDVSGLSPGAYLVNIHIEGEVFTTKIIKK